MARDNASATEALETAADEGRDFDLVILDRQLEAERGTDLIPIVRSLHPDATIAVVSAFLDARTEVELAYRCDFTVTKPVDRLTFGRMIERVLEQRAKRGAPLVACFQDAHLSARERDVAVATLRGQSPKEIARALGIGRASVYTYLQRVCSKTGCSSQLDLVAQAARRSERA